ncbi:MAG TPA: PDZ domain-containing protein, partial [Burkholderiales bacterium]|nr:PDZ domain-containing protein [Burkholderiales bacterium]
MSTLTRTLPLLLILAGTTPTTSPAQSREGMRRAEAARYLSDVHADVKRAYYDREFRGVDLELEYDSAKARLARAQSDQERFWAIDRYLHSLKDSHTYFVGLLRVGLGDFNLDFQFFGESAYVVGVDRGSYADSVGVRTGDEILEFDGQPLTRARADDVVKAFLSAHPIRPLQLKVRAPDRSVAHFSIQPDTAAIYRVKGKQLRRMLSMWRDSIEYSTSHAQATICGLRFLLAPAPVHARRS